MFAKLSELKKTRNLLKPGTEAWTDASPRKIQGPEALKGTQPHQGIQIKSQSGKQIKLKTLTLLSVWIRSWSFHTLLVGTENEQLLQETSDRVLRLQNDSATALLPMYLIESKAWAIQRWGFLCNRQKLQEPSVHSLQKNEEPQCTHTVQHSSGETTFYTIVKRKNPGKKECFISQYRVPKRSAVSWGQAGWAGERVPWGEREDCWWCVCLNFDLSGA